MNKKQLENQEGGVRRAVEARRKGKGRRARALAAGRARAKHRTGAQQARQGKGKGNGRKGEHGSKGGAGSKETQQVENLAMDEDQENMGAMTSEEEEVGRDDAAGESGTGRAVGPSGA